MLGAARRRGPIAGGTALAAAALAVAACSGAGAGSGGAPGGATGTVEHQISIGQGLPHFSSLSLSGSTAYVSTLGGITAINGA
jgi:hypothetical protein